MGDSIDGALNVATLHAAYAPPYLFQPVVADSPYRGPPPQAATAATATAAGPVAATVLQGAEAAAAVSPVTATATAAAVTTASREGAPHPGPDTLASPPPGSPQQAQHAPRPVPASPFAVNRALHAQLAAALSQPASPVQPQKPMVGGNAGTAAAAAPAHPVVLSEEISLGGAARAAAAAAVRTAVAAAAVAAATVPGVTETVTTPREASPPSTQVFGRPGVSRANDDEDAVMMGTPVRSQPQSDSGITTTQVTAATGNLSGCDAVGRIILLPSSAAPPSHLSGGATAPGDTKAVPGSSQTGAMTIKVAVTDELLQPPHPAASLCSTPTAAASPRLQALAAARDARLRARLSAPRASAPQLQPQQQQQHGAAPLHPQHAKQAQQVMRGSQGVVQQQQPRGPAAPFPQGQLASSATAARSSAGSGASWLGHSCSQSLQKITDTSRMTDEEVVAHSHRLTGRIMSEVGCVCACACTRSLAESQVGVHCGLFFTDTHTVCVCVCVCVCVFPAAREAEQGDR